MSNGRISTEQIVEYVKEELSDLREQNLISPGMYQKKSNFRLIMRALNQADRDICMFEKYEDTVAIFCKAGRKTIFFENQKEHVKEFFNQHSSLKTSDVSQYAHLIDDQSFLDVVSPSSSEGYVFDDIPLGGEKTYTTIERGTINDVYSAQSDAQVDAEYDDRFQTYFTVHPEERKMILSQPFPSDKWVVFEAKIAPQEIDVLNLQKARLESYEIIAPYYCKAWLLLKTLTELLPITVASEAGLLAEEDKNQRKARRMKPGSGNIVIGGDEYEGAYQDEFDDL